MRWSSALVCLWYCSLWHHIETVEQLHSTFGYFASPGYPSVYGNNLHKEWMIRVREGYRIKLRFTAFDIEDSYDEDRGGACAYDYVKVFDDQRTIGRFCGNYTYYPWDAPRPRRWYYSQNSTMMLGFVSDFSNDGISPYGFQAHYVEVDIDECVEKRRKLAYAEDWDKMLICSHFCNNVPGTYYCDCRNGFTLHRNNHTCIATFCENQILTDDSGVIESPEYPHPYAKLSQCTWDIQVRDGLTILVRFDELFEIEEHPEAGCVYDSLKLTYGYKYNASVYCGKYPPNNGSTIDLNSKNLKVEFKTDLAIEGTGFRMTYNTSRIRCREEIVPLIHGQIQRDSSNDYNEFEDVITFACDRGYDLLGSALLFCRSDGTWDNPQPICQIKSCGDPKKLLAIANSHIVGYKSGTYLGVLTVHCNDWYKMTEGHPSWICEDNEEWMRHGDSTLAGLPVCSPICGIKKSVPRESSIKDGIAVANEWPWMVFINFGDQQDLGTKHAICGGSIINSRYVLTAAHCLLNVHGKRDARTVHVWLGAHDRRNDAGARYVRADELITHSRYGSGSRYDYDVGLIRLAETITMNEYHRPVCLPSTTSEYHLANGANPSTMWITGWVVSSPTSSPQDVLHELEVNIFTRDECREAFRDHANKKDRTFDADVITDNMFCVGSPHNKSGACEGDSGSPLMMERNTDEYVQIGLVSFGTAVDCNSIKYSVYTKLTEEIVQWMMNSIET